ERLGGFDERYPCYGWEDLDLGLRFERAGGRIVFDPTAKAVHDHPAMSRERLWRREQEMGRTAWIFYEKWKDEAPEAAESMRFWPEPGRLHPGPGWRRRFGDRLIAMLDRFAPDSALNARLYERMIYAHRLLGVWEASRASEAAS